MATIIFDFDGTISDSFDYVADFMMAEKRLMPLDKDTKDKLRHLSMVGMARQLGFRWWQGPLLFFKGRRRMNASITDLKAFKGIPQLLRKLSAEGHELFILSNNSKRNIQRFLVEQKIDGYFLDVYGGAGLFSKAPALRRLFRDQNLNIDEAVYVGDELRDVEAAHAIGLRPVAVSWGFADRKSLKAAKPFALADTPTQLLRILEDL